ncbi:hypothetical protein HBI56_050930 [Parastagonospora nodorum]|uniref:Fe2OG dioxygenase domain-containing protein n=2 Tax=Phaeosphaeria nodorum (strain SN15 / ATCC MYA-4574 / FGSC 10173) TaxID=321614 RepID=A0A7U2NRC6_PHANO|nr:hypothetical protein SNOG_13033 [Parastagonospora nodorum SN15]KAH3903950.1 hypothetical protein HBH56_241790 [Parastagonospora nodorum]EAT79360.1 hypothetical protein SNOG_13033 [Parastagonospora nodorum SN15]KAH3930430.1 hypothetical protein HBH54_115550 [Parastagonospora nodorum]KAH3942883.1 hypothetical protein HBH53_180230 [Parastagonospora nodorum]KAH3964606.1 hypothetical protein HBH51_156520 [Parastagonospora nodorum]
MTVNGTDGSADGCQYVVAGIDMSDLFPAPFPNDVKTVHLETLSLAKLLQNDEGELRRIYENCKDPGFFQLDLTDDDRGIQLLRDSVDCARLVRQLGPNMSIEEKKTYKQHDRVGPFSKGYQVYDILPNGQPKYNETLNFDMTEVLGYSKEPTELPSWLRPYKELVARTMRSGNTIANICLKALEVGLQLPRGALTDAHRIEDPSDDFLRLLRYPGAQPDQPRDDLTFPAHKDFTSIGLLFTWLGGLQLPALGATPGAKSSPMTGPLDIPEDQWRWVKPVPGTAIVNVGSQLEFLTNKALTAGLHRVVRAPGEQNNFDRYSVLVQTRWANRLPMKPLQSPQISSVLDEAATQIATMTGGEWSSQGVGSFSKWVTDRTQRKEVLIVQ